MDREHPSAFARCLFFPYVSEVALGEKLHGVHLDPLGDRPFTIWSALS